MLMTTRKQTASSTIVGRSSLVDSPTVFNAGLNFKQSRDGRAATLERQVDGPVQSPQSMGILWPDVVAKLYHDEDYPGQFAALFPDGISRGGVSAATPSTPCSSSRRGGRPGEDKEAIVAFIETLAGEFQGAIPMKPGALTLGVIVSILLLAAASGLYVTAGSQGAQHYRALIDLIRQIQKLSSIWSIEIARVRSEPLADFDSLAAFVPRMARLEERLADTSRRIPDLPDRLASDIQVYLSLVDAKEERIERFKTGYAVVRNPARDLPLAAANVTRHADEAGDGSLSRSISILLQNMNLYLATPSDAGRERLGAVVEKLREDSVTYPPQIANALTDMLAHANILLARQAPADVLFHEATSNETAVLADRLRGSLEYEIARQDALAANYEHGFLAVIGVLALFWIALAVHQRARVAAPAAPGVAEAVTEDDAPLLPSPARQHELADLQPGTADLERVPTRGAECRERHAVSVLLRTRRRESRHCRRADRRARRRPAAHAPEDPRGIAG